MAGRFQLWHQPPGQIHQGSHIHLDHIQLTLQWQIGKIAPVAKTGIIDQASQFHIMGSHIRDQFFCRTGLGQIGGDTHNLKVMALTQLTGQCFQSLQTPRRQHQVVPLGSQLASKLFTNTGAGTGNQYRFHRTLLSGTPEAGAPSMQISNHESLK